MAIESNEEYTQELKELYEKCGYLVPSTESSTKQYDNAIYRTIQKAIAVAGPEVLQQGEVFLNMLEDLSPELQEPRELLKRAYSNELGKIFYDTYQNATAQEKQEEYLEQAKQYLNQVNRLDVQSGQRIIEIFRLALCEELGKKVKVEKELDLGVESGFIFEPDAVQGIENILSQEKTEEENSEPERVWFVDKNFIEICHNFIKMADSTTELQEYIQQIEEWGDNCEGLFQHMAAVAYYHGIGMKQDLRKAFSLFEKAAGNGEGAAMNYLAHMYEAGEGVEKNIMEALVWLNSSIESGYVDVFERKEKLVRALVDQLFLKDLLATMEEEM